VISPLLCNLFLNYAFDRWMVAHHPIILFERFADDILCHCGSETQSETLKNSLDRRFAECGLDPESCRPYYRPIDPVGGNRPRVPTEADNRGFRSSGK